MFSSSRRPSYERVSVNEVVWLNQSMCNEVTESPPRQTGNKLFTEQRSTVLVLALGSTRCVQWCWFGMVAVFLIQYLQLRENISMSFPVYECKSFSELFPSWRIAGNWPVCIVSLLHTSGWLSSGVIPTYPSLSICTFKFSPKPYSQLERSDLSLPVEGVQNSFSLLFCLAFSWLLE